MTLAKLPWPSAADQISDFQIQESRILELLHSSATRFVCLRLLRRPCLSHVATALIALNAVHFVNRSLALRMRLGWTNVLQVELTGSISRRRQMQASIFHFWDSIDEQ